MKVLQLISGALGQGGAERLVIDLSETMARKGHDVTICCFRKPSDEVVGIGAGSAVANDIPSGSVVGGNPARVICSTEEYIAKQKSLMNDENVFDASYTLPTITEEKKTEMKRILQKEKHGFVV